MHNLDDRYSTRPGLEPSTPEFRVATGSNEPSGSAVVKESELLNPFKPEFTIVIFIHNKPRIAVAILDLLWFKN